MANTQPKRTNSSAPHNLTAGGPQPKPNIAANKGVLGATQPAFKMSQHKIGGSTGPKPKRSNTQPR
jgi:hypothetical protein